jgi:hypothetical protein
MKIKFCRVPLLVAIAGWASQRFVEMFRQSESPQGAEKKFHSSCSSIHKWGIIILTRRISPRIIRRT